MKLQPVIKWTGSKRSVAEQLSVLFPEYNRAFEPFVGGGSMLPYYRCNHIFASDIIPELIDLWAKIKNPNWHRTLNSVYDYWWGWLQKDGPKVYYEAREVFNLCKSGEMLLFLSRTCANGLIRYNKKGEFNTSFHITRPGIHPTRLSSIIAQWHPYLSNVKLRCADYIDALSTAEAGDFIFLDPPYQVTNGQYGIKNFDYDRLWAELERLNSVGAKWMLTFDGKSGNKVYDDTMPHEVYKRKLEIKTGISSFRRMHKISLDQVTESVYMNYE